MRIKAGPNAGYLWSIATRRAFLTGNFERSRMDAIQALAKGRQGAWDIGASLGYVTLTLSRSIAAGPLVAIEPNKTNLWYLKAHLRWNGVQNCQVLQSAVSENRGTAKFNPRSSGTGFVTTQPDSRAYEVESLTLDDLLSFGIPEFVKIDIDHKYVDCLSGAAELLALPNLVLLIATNGAASIHSSIAERLAGAGLRVIEPDRCRLGQKGIEPELLALGRESLVEQDVIDQFIRS